VLISPAGAVYRWELSGGSDGAVTPENAAAFARTYHRGEQPLRSRLTLTYRLEGGPDAAPDRATGCTDRRIILARTLFGIEIGRAAIQCNGVEVSWKG
jgi:hypothetical protein